MKLNVAGWAAILAPGVVLGGTVGLLMRKPIVWCALAGSGASWACAVLVDTRQWRASEISIMLPQEFSDDDRAQLLAAFEVEGVDASIRTETNHVTAELYWQAVTTMRFRDAVDRQVIRLSGAAEVSA